MPTQDDSFSRRVIRIADGQAFEESVLHAASAQMQRLSLILEAQLHPSANAPEEPALQRLAQQAQQIIDACTASGLLCGANQAETEIDFQAERLAQGADAALASIDHNASHQARATLADAVLVMAACERHGLLAQSIHHAQAHRALTNGEWDHPALMAVGPLRIEAEAQRKQIDDHYLDLYALQYCVQTLRATNAPSNRSQPTP